MGWDVAEQWSSALTTLLAGTTSAQASTIHSLPSTVVTAESSSGHGCEAWLLSDFTNRE
jgi:hypothetical protein